ncbi:uncharacterized protein LOC128952730 [Oppia nitens]|uniref:uncharacterized protein LOC128952730 n=1 Tax=Oppia nitens TaxID=1686743 RepID=UPI0023DB3A71|nr:uncharacterized protein LOC128952730 [Oppia nitens]
MRSTLYIECGIKVIADDAFLEDCLRAHNKYRDLHENTERLQLNRTATEYALNRIRSLAKIDGQRPVSDSQRTIFGENFYWYYDSKGYHSCANAIDLWYKGKDQYDYNRPGFHEKTGGFSQVVWRGSQYLGCARVEDDTRQYYETYIVCNYWPAGNVDSRYPYNVFPLRDHQRPSLGVGSGSGAGISPIAAVSGSHRPTSSNQRPTVSGGWLPDRPDRPNHRPPPPIAPNYPLYLSF